jgi:hypothetical protein
MLVWFLVLCMTRYREAGVLVVIKSRSRRIRTRDVICPDVVSGFLPNQINRPKLSVQTQTPSRLTTHQYGVALCSLRDSMTSVIERALSDECCGASMKVELGQSNRGSPFSHTIFAPYHQRKMITTKSKVHEPDLLYRSSTSIYHRQLRINTPFSIPHFKAHCCSRQQGRSSCQSHHQESMQAEGARAW